MTGANGFVGKALTQALLEGGIQVRMTGQMRVEPLEAMGAEWFAMPDLGEDVDWRPALEGTDAVVHLAGIAHRMESVSVELARLYDQVNHRATRSLALATAANARIQRFLFVSSVRVHGDPVRLPVTRDSTLAPVTRYDQSKVDAELAIREVLSPEQVAWAILRPVLVYGPGNRGNMQRLEGLLRHGIPVPVTRVPNRRSFLFIGNLVSAIQEYLSIQIPPSGKTWIVADGEVASTERLIRAMATGMGLPSKVIHLPSAILRGGARIGDFVGNFGMQFPWNSEVQQKLNGDFYVDISPLQEELGWVPPISLESGVALTYQK